MPSRPSSTAVDGQRAEHAIGAADVIGLRMGADEHVQAPDAEVPQLLRDRPVRRTAVDEHRVPVRLDERRVALADVEERQSHHARRGPGDRARAG